MKWSNLKLNKCPKCGKDTALKEPYEEVDTGKTKLLVHKCGFKISEKKYENIVSDMVSQNLEKEAGGLLDL